MRFQVLLSVLALAGFAAASCNTYDDCPGDQVCATCDTGSFCNDPCTGACTAGGTISHCVCDGGWSC